MLYDERSLDKVSHLLKVMSDKTRMKILLVLQHQELYVQDISEQLNMTISAISHQLKILKDAKLVKVRREGKYNYYMIDDDHVKDLLHIALVHIKEEHTH